MTDRFLSVCDFYFNELGVPFEGIAVCSEQNGVLVLDEHDQPVTSYISWKDERSLLPVDGLSTFALVTERLGGASMCSIWTMHRTVSFARAQ